MRPAWRWGIVAVIGALVAARATAHLPALRGHLVELVQRSDVIVIATVEEERELGPRSIETRARVHEILSGRIPQAPLTFAGAVRFAPQVRYVFFLRRTPGGLECVQPAAAVFPTPPADDAVYRRVIAGITAALRVDDATSAERLRAALRPGLSSGNAPLRYEAALELAGRVDDAHPLTAGERAALTELLASPNCDPALHALLAPLIGGS